MSSTLIVTRPGEHKSYSKPIVNFVDVISPSVGNLYLLSNKRTCFECSLPPSHCIFVDSPKFGGPSLFSELWLQIHISLLILLNHRKFDNVYFQKGTMIFALPVLVSQLIGLRPCVIKVGAFHRERDNYSTKIIGKITEILEHVTFKMAYATVVFSRSEVSTVPNSTVFVGYSNFRDFDKFSKVKPISSRQFDIGFVGRFSQVKGIRELAEAVELMLSENSNVRACLIGDGPLYDEINTRFQDNPRVELPGWIPNTELPSLLNEIKVLFMPSKAEGLPTTLLEAMGCGSVVACTPVGSLPDLITHGETGFILEDGEPCSLKEAFQMIMDNQELEAISSNACLTASRNYNYDSARTRFDEIQKYIVRDDMK